MADDPIIIVDDKGVEHEFPPGFDPVRAAGIVRAQSGQRRDASAIGFDVNKWTDMASRFPEPIRKPAAAVGTFLGTLLEGASAPESIATLGVGRVPSAKPNYLAPSIRGPMNALGRTIEAGPTAGGRVGVIQRVLGRVLQLPKEPMAPGVEPHAPSVSGYGGPGSAGLNRGPLPQPSLDPHMPNVSGYGGPGSAGLNRGPLPQPSTAAIDRYAPSTSGYVAGEAPSAVSQAHPGFSMPQATYAAIPDKLTSVYGQWGLEGAGLQPGMRVTATNRAGQQAVHTVGRILNLPGGQQIAVIVK